MCRSELTKKITGRRRVEARNRSVATRIKADVRVACAEDIPRPGAGGEAGGGFCAPTICGATGAEGEGGTGAMTEDVDGFDEVKVEIGFSKFGGEEACSSRLSARRGEGGQKKPPTKKRKDAHEPAGPR